MIRPELEALLHGALDNTLTADERAQLARLLSESPEARERAAELNALAGLIESLGPADVPAGLVDHVLAQVSHRPHVIRHATFQRGVAVNKKILFGLAAAAAIVLAVITYNSNPPATVGTEATIGAAQRAQAPQIAPSDVKLGDTSAQDVLQTAEWDEIMRDEDLRTALQDENFRTSLLDMEIRQTLTNAAVLRAIKSNDFRKQISDEAMVRHLDDAAFLKKLEDTDLRVTYSNRAFVNALKNNAGLRKVYMRPGLGAAMAKASFQSALRGSMDRAIRQADFVSRLAAAGARVNTGARVTSDASAKK